MESEPEIEDFGEGENPGVDLRVSVARRGNKVFKEANDTTVGNFGPGVGELQLNKLRLRDSIKEGHLNLYIRQESKDPKVILPATIIALGLVATAIYKQKHRRQ